MTWYAKAEETDFTCKYVIKASDRKAKILMFKAKIYEHFEDQDELKANSLMLRPRHKSIFRKKAKIVFRYYIESW